MRAGITAPQPTSRAGAAVPACRRELCIPGTAVFRIRTRHARPERFATIVLRSAEMGCWIADGLSVSLAAPLTYRRRNRGGTIVEVPFALKVRSAGG